MDLLLSVIKAALSTDPLTLSQCSVLVLSIGFVMFALRKSKWAITACKNAYQVDSRRWFGEL